MNLRIAAISCCLILLGTLAWAQLASAQDAPPNPNQGNPPQDPPATDPPATDPPSDPPGDANRGEPGQDDQNQDDQNQDDQNQGDQNQGDDNQDGDNQDDENAERGRGRRGFDGRGFGGQGFGGQNFGGGRQPGQDNEPVVEREGERWRFAYHDTPWDLVIEQYVEASELSFYYKSMPQNTLTYENDRRAYNLSEWLNFLNSMLIFEDYTLVRHERMLILTRIDELPKQVLNPQTRAILDGEDAIGDYEWATILFQLSRYAAEDAQTDITALLGPSEFVTSIPRARQVVVTAMGKKLRMASDMIDHVEKPGGLEDFRIFTVKNISTTEALSTVKRMLGIPQDLFDTEDGETRIAEDMLRNRIIVKASPSTLDMIDSLLKSLDPEESTDTSIVEQPPLELKAYGTTGVAPAQVLSVAQSLLTGIPGVRLGLDELSGNLLVYARAPEHEMVDNMLATMTDKAQKMPHVFQLAPNADPAMAQILISGLFNTANNTPTASSPTLQINTASNQLVMMGTSAQITAAEQALKSMNWLMDAEAGIGSDGYYVFNGSRNIVDAYIGMLRGEYGTGRIKVVVPAELNRGRVREIPRQEDRIPPGFEDAFNNGSAQPTEGGAANEQPTLNRNRPEVPQRQQSPVYERQHQPQGRIVSLVPLKGDQYERVARNQGYANQGYVNYPRQQDQRSQYRDTPLPRGPLGAVAVDGGIIIRGRQGDVDGLQDVGNDIFGDEIPSSKDQAPKQQDPEEEHDADSCDGNCHASSDEELMYETALQDAALQDDAATQAGAPNDLPVGEQVEQQAVDNSANAASSQDNENPDAANQQPSGLEITVIGNQVIVRSDDPKMLADAKKMWEMLGGNNTGIDGNLPYIFYLKYTDCVDVADFLNKMLGGGAVPGGEDASGGNMLGNLASGFLGGGAGDLLGGLMGGGQVSYATSNLVRIVPESRSNALFVQGPPEMIDYITEVLAMIDLETPPENDVSRIPQSIPVQFHSAEEIAQNVREIFASELMTSGGNGGGGGNQQEQFIRALMQGGRGGRGGRGRGGNNGGGGGNTAQSDAMKMTLSVDAANNALLVAAPQELFQRVEAFVQMLDQNAQPNMEVVRVMPVDGVNPEWVIDILQNVMGDRLQTNVALARPSTNGNNNRFGGGTSRFGTNNNRGGGNFNFGNFGGNRGGNTGFTRGNTGGRNGGGNTGGFGRGGGGRNTGGFGGGGRGGRGGGNTGGGRGGGGRGGGGRGGR